MLDRFTLESVRPSMLPEDSTLSFVPGLGVPMPTLLFVHTGFVPFHWPHIGIGTAAIAAKTKPAANAPRRSLRYECVRIIAAFLSSWIYSRPALRHRPLGHAFVETTMVYLHAAPIAMQAQYRFFAPSYL
jgi:hypothetical protein